MSGELDQAPPLPPRWREFAPPRSGRVAVPPGSRPAALAGIGLYAACRRWPLIAQRGVWWTVRLVGPMVLPSRRRAEIVDPETWNTLWRCWRDAVGPIDDFAIYHRPQRSRSGFAVVLLHAGQPRAFVKVHTESARAFDNEWTAMRAVHEAGPRSFAIPRPLVVGHAAGYSFIVMGAMHPSVHRPPTDAPLELISREVSQALEVRGGAEQFPDHYRPMHGDFTPWNLRQQRDGSLMLLDWEDSSWGPPGADMVLFRALDAVMNHRPVPHTQWTEAAVYWRDLTQSRLERSTDHDRGRRTSVALVRMLEAMAR